MYVLYTDRQLSFTGNLKKTKIIRLAKVTNEVIHEYENANSYPTLLHSVSKDKLDIDEQFYNFIHPQLIDIWQLGNIVIKPIEYWTHQYVRYGAGMNLTFKQYYKKAIELYKLQNSNFEDTNNMCKEYCYNNQWKKL